MKSRLLLDIVVEESAAFIELLSGKDQTLLIRRNSLLVLDLGLYVLDRVAGFDLESDSLSSEGLGRVRSIRTYLDKDLHSITFTYFPPIRIITPNAIQSPLSLPLSLLPRPLLHTSSLYLLLFPLQQSFLLTPRIRLP